MIRSAARTVIADWLRTCGSRLLVLHDQIIPAASLWVVMRQWVSAYRGQQLVPGSAVGFALPCNAAGVAAWFAAAWENLAIVLPSHPAYGEINVRCAAGGTFEPALDRLAPHVQPTVAGSRVLVPGVYADNGVESWDELFAPTTSGLGTRSLVARLDGGEWLTAAGMRELTHATVHAEEIWFTNEW